MTRFVEGVHYVVDNETGCWKWIRSILKNGYGNVRFQGKVRRAHRVAWTIANGPIPEGRHVLHSCDRPSCVNPDHLRIGTNADNVADRMRRNRGRYNYGEGNHRAKLTADQVDDLRRRYDHGETRADLARSFGISWTTTNRIVKGEIWQT